ncbi:MAG TPA: hypothetical protein VNA14_07115 [Mycobacteriales bacterium]|nr:hypothetical protein [Mycobacteriales bacterium]
MAATKPTPVYLERGKTWVFACTIEWPGWCRRGRGDEAALEALRSYADRYAQVAGDGFRPGTLVVIGEVPGSVTTDFGAPDGRGPWDDDPLTKREADRQAGLLEAAWSRLDDVVATAPASLRKGPRGGGRDRDAVAEHVREAERSYGRMIGVRVPPRTPWPEQHAEISAAIRSRTSEARWPLRYAVRRIAWHVLDHAWEIEDRSDPA